MDLFGIKRRRLQKENELNELKIFKKCAMKFMKDTGISPINLGLTNFSAENVTYTFNREESEYLIQDIRTMSNPIHRQIYQIFRFGLKK